MELRLSLGNNIRDEIERVGESWRRCLVLSCNPCNLVHYYRKSSNWFPWMYVEFGCLNHIILGEPHNSVQFVVSQAYRVL